MTVACIILLVVGATGNALVRPDIRFTGNATVFLQDSKVKIFGTARSTPSLDIWMNGEKVASNVPVQQNSTWQAVLPPVPPGYNKTLTFVPTAKGANYSMLVSYGRVILCSGQSNMGMKVGPAHFHADNGTAEALASSRYTGKISLSTGAGKPWTTVSNATLPTFSAVCWYSGRHFFDETDGTVPLGGRIFMASRCRQALRLRRRPPVATPARETRRLAPAPVRSVPWCA